MLGRIEAARPEYERARKLWASQRPGAPDRSYLFRQRGRFTFEVDSYELALLRVKTGSFPHSPVATRSWRRAIRKRRSSATTARSRSSRTTPTSPR